MSRYERDQFFEALWAMRAGYATRPDDDRGSSLSIGDAILYAEAVMQALDAEESAADVEADAPFATESTASGDSRD
jgi:hypothetical protein